MLPMSPPTCHMSPLSTHTGLAALVAAMQQHVQHRMTRLGSGRPVTVQTRGVLSACLSL